MQVLILGTAGSGKTQLSYSYAKWLRQRGLDAKVINLDPGAEVTPYEPDWDIRTIVSVDELMVSENLGPNGAMIRAAQLMLENSTRIASEVRDMRGDFLIYDTPGQIELFVFHSSGPALISELSKMGRAVGVFLLDPTLMSNPANVASALTHSIIVRVRLGIPLVVVTSKSDLNQRGDLARMLSDVDYLDSEVAKSNEGSASEIAGVLVDVVRRIPLCQRVLSVSSMTQEGFEDFYSLLHEAFCACGDLT